jgi:type I restriction enzyme, S subunit
MSKKKLIPELRFPEFKNEGEWEIKTIGDVANSESSSMALNKLNLKPTGYPVYGADSIVGYIDEFQHKEKYISIVKDGSGVGRLNLCQSNSSILGTLTSLKSKNNKRYDLDWLYYLLNTVDFSVYVKGAGIPHIYYSDFKNQNVPFPTPKEQQKIASCLSSLDEVITAHNQKLDLLKGHKKGLMQNLFPQEGEKVPKYRFPEFKKDGAWKIMTLGKISKITSGGTPNRSEDNYWNGDIPWISTTLIDFNTINGANEYITEVGLLNSSAKIFPKGTILMAMYGQGKTRGKVGVLGIDAATNQACAAILLKEGYSTDYIFQYLAAHYDDIRELSNKGGQENLSGGLIEFIPLSIPSPKEQQKIASCLSSLDDIISTLVDKIEQLKQHKKGLMQGLFPKIKA